MKIFIDKIKTFPQRFKELSNKNWKKTKFTNYRLDGQEIALQLLPSTN